MYRTAQQRKWDQQNVIDYAREEGIEIGRHAEKMANAKNLKIQGVDIKIIAAVTGLSIDEIIAL